MSTEEPHLDQYLHRLSGDCVDLRLLTGAERVEYAKQVNFISQPEIGLMLLRKEDKNRLWTLIFRDGIIGSAVVVVAAALIWARWGHVASTSAAAIASFMVAPWFWYFSHFFHGRSALRRSARRYLEGIGYYDRTKSPEPKQPPRPSTNGSAWGDDGWQPTSKRQAQHAWYEGHSDLNWRDRVTAELYGMDVDTYVNNWKEHDPS